MAKLNSVLPLRSDKLFHLPEAKSVMNKFGDYTIPQHPQIAPNNCGSPHQDAWCSESVSLDGPTSGSLLLTVQNNPFGYTPNMVCNQNNQMIGVSLAPNKQFWLVVFTKDCEILAASPLNDLVPGSFGGGYFYLDANDNTIVVSANKIYSFPTQDVQPSEDGSIYKIPPTWVTPNIVEMVYAQQAIDFPNLPAEDPSQNSLYANLPVWSEVDGLYWCLIAGSATYNDPNPELISTTYMAVVQVNLETGATELVDYKKLPKQWNNNSFSVAEEGAYIVTNGFNDAGVCDEGYLWSFGLENNKIKVRWKSHYENAGYLKPGQTNIGSGTTPTLTETKEGLQLVAITDNADPQLNIVVYRRDNGEKVSQAPCFEPMRSADEASLIGVGQTFVAENNFGHYPTFPFSQLVPNGKGMTMIEVDPGTGENPNTMWEMPQTHFYAMNMLCRNSGIIFAHTCSWDDAISSTEGGMYYISAIDSYNGHTIWQIPLGRGTAYCHEYGGIYFNLDGDLFIGTNEKIVCIKNYNFPAKGVKNSQQS